MGKRGHNKSRNHFAEKKREKKERVERPERQEPYEEIVRDNETFNQYYKHQKICPEDEWDSFMQSIKSNLPTTFRITGSKGQVGALLDIIKNDFFTEYLKGSAELHESNEIEKPKCLLWYPNELAWQLELSRKDIRRSEPLYRLHNFLIAETSSGNISRQEAVSMIPPLVLGVESHHKVLDMCAAPGSKTAQLIEALHSGSNTKIPTGFVLANDVDNNRCYMLVHQAKRLSSPCFLVTNNDSTLFPGLNVKNEKGELEAIRFDRVLCDVPCSGDGTMRKNPDIWNKWNLGQAANLHGVQFRIAKRGCELLAVGGRLVYSTCSLNPMENEAVLARLLAETEHSMEIIDAAHLLPTLNYSKGMTYWEPTTKDLQFFKNFEEVPEKFHTVIRPQMFPPKPEDVSKYNLEKCIRILPHQQNTGGFFVALLEKKKKLPWESEKSTPETDETRKPFDAILKSKPKRAKGLFKEDPFVFMGEKDDIFESIKEFYHLSDDFDCKNLLTRCVSGKKKNIYFCSEIVRNLVQNNEKYIRIINTGVKTFARCDNKNMNCAFRLAQEGLESSNPFIGSCRRLKIAKVDLIELLQCTDPTKPPEVTTLSEKTRKNLEGFGGGSCVLEFADEKLSLNLVGWRGTRSLRAYVDRDDSIHMLRLLGADMSKYETNKFETKRAAVAEGTSVEETKVEKDGDKEENVAEMEQE